MKKFRNVPAVVTLFAGLVSSIIMILQKYTLVQFLWTLIAVMLLFYIAGLLVRVLLNKAFKDLEAQEDESEEENGDKQEADSEDKGNTKEEGDDGNSKK